MRITVWYSCLAFFAVDFVKDNGHCNSQYGAQPDKYQVIEQGIPDHDEGIFCAEKEFKVF